MKRKRQVAVVATWHLGTSHRLLDGISEYIETAGDILLQFSGTHMIPAMVEWDLDGMIAPIFEESAHVVAAAPFPVVSTNGSPGQILPSVDVDPEACGAMAADYFLGLGHANFATVCRPASVGHRLRSEGFVNRLKEQGVRSVAERFLEFGETEASGSREEIIQWIRALDKPVAVFCTDDGTAKSLLSLMGEEGICAPEDVSVLGSENERMLCEHVHPTLSSIQLPYKQMGYEAARLLDQLMQGETPKKMHRLLPPEQVTVRMSTNTLATPDIRLRKAFHYIQEHSAENIAVGQIAEFVGISVRDLQRRFKAALGRSPQQELHLIRIGHVKELLRRTDLTLSEIAEKTGFESEYWMGTLFKNITGAPPGAYRRKHRLR